MNLEEIIRELRKKHDLGLLKPDSDGVYHFSAGDRHHLSLGEGATKEQLFLYAHLSEIPKEGHTNLLRKLLEANLFGTETNGATLSLDKSNNRVVLFQPFDCGTATFDQFHASLETFLGTLHRWQTTCAEALTSGKDDDPDGEREFDGLKI